VLERHQLVAQPEQVAEQPALEQDPVQPGVVLVPLAVAQVDQVVLVQPVELQVQLAAEPEQPAEQPAVQQAEAAQPDKNLFYSIDI
jgi:hypothetical protein